MKPSTGAGAAAVKKKGKKQRGKRKKGQGGGKALEDLSVEEMFSMVHDDDDDSASDGEAAPAETTPTKKKTKKAKKTKENVKPKEDADDDDDYEGDMDEDMDDATGMDEDDDEDKDVSSKPPMSQAKYLQWLKKTDPSFYKTMMKSKDVMMGLDGIEGVDDGTDDDDDEDVEEDQVKEEVDSDASDAEDEKMARLGSNVVRAQLVADWHQALMGDSPGQVLVEVSQGLLAATQSLKTPDQLTDEAASKYRVVGAQMFNAVVRVCLRCVPRALNTMLKLKPADEPTKSKRWNKHERPIKTYLKNFLNLVEMVTEPSIAEVVVGRGVSPLVPYYAGFPSLARQLLKALVAMWSTSEKKVRVMAFLCIFRLSRLLPTAALESTLKMMYMAYVRNSKFTSPNTWAVIHFMRVSLAEMFALDAALAFKNGFVYIRQLAIHLRNAITNKSQDTVKQVYNWQFVHCIHLWTDLLAKTHPNTTLQPLLYPLVQVCLGTVRLQASMAYWPLTFHLCEMLTALSRQTNTFIPVAPLLLEVLNRVPLNKKPKKWSVRPFRWECMLRLSSQELQESAFRDGVVDRVYDGLLNHLAVDAHSIAFPELVVPARLQLRDFIKKCSIPNYSKKMKQLLDKLKDNSAFIETRRLDVTFNIDDVTAVRHWEIGTRQAGTPLHAFYQSWRKIKEKEAQLSTATELDPHSLPAHRREDYEVLTQDQMKRLQKQIQDDDDETTDDDDVSIDEDDESIDEEEDEEEEDLSKNKKHRLEDGQDEPPKKKKKGGKQPMEVEEVKEEEEDEEDDEEDLADLDGEEDQVKEIKFSDLESEGEDEKDDYGVDSD